MILARGYEKLQCLTTCSEQCTKLFKANNGWNITICRETHAVTVSLRNFLQRQSHIMDKIPLYKLLLSIHYWKVQAINSIDAICDWACKNRAYLHIKIGMFFELQLAITFKIIRLCHWNIYAILTNQSESRWSLQNVFTTIIDQDKCNFLNMCILCRYARFPQAQSHI